MKNSELWWTLAAGVVIVAGFALDELSSEAIDTPGSSDRGARRIVAGADGERYWTDDHYDSISEIQF